MYVKFRRADVVLMALRYRRIPVLNGDGSRSLDVHYVFPLRLDRWRLHLGKPAFDVQTLSFLPRLRGGNKHVRACFNLLGAAQELVKQVGGT